MHGGRGTDHSPQRNLCGSEYCKGLNMWTLVSRKPPEEREGWGHDMVVAACFARLGVALSVVGHLRVKAG